MWLWSTLFSRANFSRETSTMKASTLPSSTNFKYKLHKNNRNTHFPHDQYRVYQRPDLACCTSGLTRITPTVCNEYYYKKCNSWHSSGQPDWWLSGFVALQLIWFSSLQSRQTAQLHNTRTLLFTQGDFVATYMLKCPHHQAPRFTVSTLEGHMHSKNHRRVTLMCPSCGTCVLYCISEFLYPSIHPFLCLTETLCQNFPKCTIAWIVYLTTVSVLLTCASSLLFSGCCNTYTCRLYCYCIVVSHMNSWWMSECSM